MEMTKEKKSTWVRWSDDEVDLLRKHFSKGKVRKVVELTGRPLSTVRQKAYDIGLKSGQKRPWSTQEKEQLKNLYKSHTPSEIAKRIGRTAAAVTTQSSAMGLAEGHLWLEKEAALLKGLYHKSTVQGISDKIRRSEGA